MIDEKRADDGIRLPKVTSKILSRVVEYCKKHVDADRAFSVDDDHLKAWDAEFVKVDPATLMDLVMAAYDLDIKGLRELTCQTVADMLKGKTSEEVRRTFNLKNDFTPEEEEEVRRQNFWVYN